MTTDTFRICHISDLHLSAGVPGRMNPVSVRRPGQSVYSAVKENMRKSGYFKGLREIYPLSSHDQLAAQYLPEFLVQLDGGDADPPLDLALITGDLATTGGGADLKFARNFLRGQVASTENTPESIPFNMLKTVKVGATECTLDGAFIDLLERDFPLFAIPGNHDRYRGFRRKPEWGHYETCFGECWDMGKNVAGNAGYGSRCLILEGKAQNNLAVIGVDFSLTSTRGLKYAEIWGQGEADLVRLASLEEATQGVRKTANTHVVWAMHFPPVSPSTDPNLQLRSAIKVVALAERLGVKLIFAGHAHEMRYQIKTGQKVHVLTAGSATCAEKVGFNMLHDIQITINNGQIDMDKLLVRHCRFDAEHRTWRLPDWQKL